MIEVKHLTKRYGSHTAVSDLSFTIEKGVIYGFLGPNGAGKSTTMNIITGCLGASAGEVTIDGHSVLDDPMQAKRRVGYLPEQPPLYTDMTPEEYLRFVMKAKNVSRDEQSKQLMQVLLMTRTVEVKDRLIRNLSKGYRQRVGIAQALLGNPEVIILDEPTVGLDPAQIIEIRQLIRDLGKNHTIVLSSHILSEVQAVCDRIMIISHGRLVASDTTENLTKLFAGTVTLRLETRAEVHEIRRILSSVPGIEKFTAERGENGVNTVYITPDENAEIREALFRAFAAADAPLLELHRETASLEDVFLELTSDSQDKEVAEA
ncbi:MAG: ABC transporter ATP-binding protein [Candidatus Faecivicinus sp.]